MPTDRKTSTFSHKHIYHSPTIYTSFFKTIQFYLKGSATILSIGILILASWLHSSDSSLKFVKVVSTFCIITHLIIIICCSISMKNVSSKTLWIVQIGIDVLYGILYLISAAYCLHLAKTGSNWHMYLSLFGFTANCIHWLEAVFLIYNKKKQDEASLLHKSVANEETETLTISNSSSLKH